MSIMILAAVLVVLGCWIAILRMGYQYEKKWTKDFELEIFFSQEQAGEGDTLWLYEVITNNKEMILPAVSVRFKTSKFLKFEDMDSGSVSDYFYRNDVISVRGYEQVRRKLRIKCARRGIYSIQEAELAGRDYFLQRTYLDKKEVEAGLIVYPSFVGIERVLPLFQKSYGDMRTSIPMFEDPFEYVGVRGYLPGDRMNRIHWNASAKTGNWQVKTSAYKAGQPALVLLNLGSPGNFINQAAMEENIRIACSLVHFMNRQGLETMLVANGGEGFRLQGSGKAYMAQVRRKLAAVTYETQIQSGVGMLQRERDNLAENVHLFFISSQGKPEIQQELAKILHRGISVTWVAVTAGGEDDTRQLLPALEPCIYRWKA